MKSVNPRYRARCTTTVGLVLLAALAVAFLQARPLMASVSTTTGQAVATPTAADAMDHAAHGASPADAAGGQMQIENMPDMESMADMDHTADMNHSAEAEHTSGAEHTADMDHTAAMDHTADT